MVGRRSPRWGVVVLLVLFVVVLVSGCGPSQRERDLEASNQKLTLQVGDLRAQLATAATARDQATQAADQARQERDAAKKNLADAEAHAAMLSQDRDAATKALATAQDQVAALTTQRDDAKAALDTATAELKKLHDAASTAETAGQANAASLKTALDAANARADGAEAEVASLKTQLAEAQAKLVAASDELTAATQARDTAQKTRSALDAQSVQQANTIAAQTQQIQVLQARVDDLQGQLDQTRQRSNTLQQTLQQTTGDLQAARDQAAQLTRNLETLLQNHQGLQQLSDAQRAELADVRQRLEAAQSQVARLTGARGIYTVQAADSLSSIATFFYHDGNRWPAIFKANAHLINDPDMIFPGMVLIVPALGGAG